MATKRKKVATDDAGFDEFWDEYPRCLDKSGTKRAYNRARLNASHDAIMAGLRAYPFSGELLFQPHSCTWLNQHRWEGYVTHQPAAVAVQRAPAKSSWTKRYEHTEVPFQSFPEGREAALNEGGPIIDGRLADD